MEKTDVYWNRLGFQDSRYIVHIKAKLGARNINFLGRFSPEGVLDGEVRKTFEVNGEPSNDRELLAEILKFVKQNWTTDMRLRVYYKGNGVYTVQVEDNEEFEMRERNKEPDKVRGKLAIDFERSQNELMVPFGDIISKVLKKASR